MEYIESSLTNGQRAFDLIDSIAAQLPYSAKLFNYDYGTEEFIGYQSGSRQFRAVHGDLKLEKVVSALKAHKRYSSHPVLIVMSDFQEPTSVQIDSALNRSGLKADIIFVSLKPESPWNYAISNVDVIGNEAVEVTTEASGKKLVNGKVRLTAGNIGTAPVKITVDENGSGRVVIPFSTSDNKICKVVLDEKDPLQFDNVTYVYSGQQKRSDILVLGNTDENFVLSAAVHALGERGGGTVTVKSCLDVTSSDIDRSSVIIINHPSVPCPGLEKFLSSRNKNGGSFIYCLSEDSLDLISDYSLLKKRFPEIGMLKHSLPAHPVNPVLPDINSGLWYGFPEKNLSQLAIASYAGVLPGIPLCHLSDGGVLFSAIDDKVGARWIISAIPLGVSNVSTVWKSAAFVPVLDRILKFLDSRGASDRVVIAGYPVRNPVLSRKEKGFIYDQEGKPVVVPDRPEMVFQTPGVYKVVASDTPVRFITVFPDSMESKMNFRTPDLNKALYNDAVICGAAEILSLTAQRSSDVLYYLPWIIIGLLVLLEVFLWEPEK
jgi:hypothetical protein